MLKGNLEFDKYCIDQYVTNNESLNDTIFQTNIIEVDYSDQHLFPLQTIKKDKKFITHIDNLYTIESKLSISQNSILSMPNSNIKGKLIQSFIN